MVEKLVFAEAGPVYRRVEGISGEVQPLAGRGHVLDPQTGSPGY
ncbi:MAG TPA: hypothetical protein VGB25_01780 [Candidatus Binatia bacterium]